MKTIICAVDYSTYSATALQYAYSYSKLLDAKLIVINVFEYPTVWNSDVPKPNFGEFNQTASEEYKAFLRNFCIKTLGKQAYEEATIELVTLHDLTVKESILNYAEKINPLLIITGARGMHKMKEFVLGSTTNDLIAEARQPILAIPKHHSFFALNNAVYATALELQDIEAIKRISERCIGDKTTLHIVHITTKLTEELSNKIETFKNKLQEELTACKWTFTILKGKSRAEELQKYLNMNETDMLIMRERSAFSAIRELWEEDFVRTMERKAMLPLLSIPTN
ncbi:universal stress protein [Zhouia sp. PK063]|uniref:universal stress protein n=1 Tax=Zhouia sp. PK063 TaxID=3373602 RepID=UPI003790F1BA